MEFNIEKATEILKRTPHVLESLLYGLSDSWILPDEGPDTWSPFDVMGHLVHGENTDWTARLKKILDPGADPHFEPFDRFAQFEESKGKNMGDLLMEFSELRRKNLELLSTYVIDDQSLVKTGIHPKFGEVTLRNLLATWVAHDLGHIGQIVRVMAKQYSVEVGPWKEYLPILNK